MLGGKYSAKWVLEGDIKGCFDNISHQWLQDNVIMNKRVLNQFLKAGYIHQKKLYPTKSGAHYICGTIEYSFKWNGNDAKE